MIEEFPFKESITHNEKTLAYSERLINMIQDTRKEGDSVTILCHALVQTLAYYSAKANDEGFEKMVIESYLDYTNQMKAKMSL